MIIHSDIKFIEEIYSSIITKDVNPLNIIKKKYNIFFSNCFEKSDKLKVFNNSDKYSKFADILSIENTKVFKSKYREDYEEYKNIEQVFDNSIDLIRKKTPWIYDLITLFDIIFCPVIKNSIIYQEEGSLSTIEAFGFIFTNYYKRSNDEFGILNLCITICHELAHHSLMVFECCDKIIINQEFETYSPLRKVKRPIIKSLHACLATSYILSFLSNYKTSDKYISNWIKEYLQDIISNSCISMGEIKEFAVFTELGKLIYEEIVSNYRNWNYYYD